TRARPVRPLRRLRAGRAGCPRRRRRRRGRPRARADAPRRAARREAAALLRARARAPPIGTSVRAATAARRARRVRRPHPGGSCERRPQGPAAVTNLRRLLLVRMLYWTHFVAAVLVPFFTDWAGLTLTQVFTLNAWFMFCLMVFEVPTGAIADRFGRKWSI